MPLIPPPSTTPALHPPSANAPTPPLATPADHADLASTVLLILTVLAGIAAAAAGAWLIWGPRLAPAPPRGRFARWRSRLSAPSRAVLGLSLLLLGYHAASWALPDHILPLRVPPHRGWILALALAAAVAASLALDRRHEPRA
ncbi:MAG: hypothetical protein HBSAPP03_06750 [Phycisphaerae bacterium]|nr:MAG: hypothetical protein HBSAPP03_06750 [Phycisphaerae bacterium]